MKMVNLNKEVQCFVDNIGLMEPYYIERTYRDLTIKSDFYNGKRRYLLKELSNVQHHLDVENDPVIIDHYVGRRTNLMNQLQSISFELLYAKRLSDELRVYVKGV